MREDDPDKDVRIGYDAANSREMQCHPLIYTKPSEVRQPEVYVVGAKSIRRNSSTMKMRISRLRRRCPLVPRHVGRTKLAHSVLSCC